MNRIASALLMLMVLVGWVWPVRANTLGIVLLHGKTASPTIGIDGLAAALQAAGYLVDTPEMCWSRRRIYDRPFPDCLGEVDAAVARLKGRRAERIVVAGMSLGGDAALVYAAGHTDLAGVIALAPAAPEREARLPEIAQGLAQARVMMSAGRGDETANFAERNANGAFVVRTTAAIYLSYLDPQGPANVLAAMQRLRMPVLWVAGNADPSQTGAQTEFQRAPANPQNSFVTVASAHLGTPNAAKDAVLGWLRTLR